jgi:hypothetical protein
MDEAGPLVGGSFSGNLGMLSRASGPLSAFGKP